MTDPRPAGPLLQYELRRTRRKTLAVVVRDDGSVEVRAPLRASAREIERVIERYGDWARARQRLHRERQALRAARQFDSGDEIPFLGRQLTLVLREGVGATPAAVLTGEDLAVTVPAGVVHAERRRVARETVGVWLLGRAREVFHERHVVASRAVGDAALAISIKEMRTRWGSCGPTRRMSVCWRLIMAPVEVIDYVLVHELTHIRQPDHSRRFWAAVATACPEWRERRAWLNAHGGELRL